MARNNIGFLDVEIRDEFNTPIFKVKRKNLRSGLNELENFCEHKLGIHPFDTKEFEEKLRKKYGLEGFSAWK